MLPLRLGSAGAPLRILCVGAHCDDIEIGCGGTIMRLLECHPGSVVRWVVFTSGGNRAAEAEASARLFLERAGESHVEVLAFRDAFLPYTGVEVKERFESLKQAAPDVIFTHCREDLHQDHRFLNELTWSTFRNDLILEYEIPKYDGDMGRPNFFVPLTEPLAVRKVRYIVDSFQSQNGRHWFSEDLFLSLLRLRAIECGGSDRYAEAFYCRKGILI
ncbi:MAG TPA: PIG-L deacetylase family protein [Bryobacteraceae bacterium]|nr:PIG-L deacetylase family protein [Bryobacteraceae bacterium]